jgi:hypothetical protein
LLVDDEMNNNSFSFVGYRRRIAVTKEERSRTKEDDEREEENGMSPDC